MLEGSRASVSCGQAAVVLQGELARAPGLAGGSQLMTGTQILSLPIPITEKQFCLAFFFFLEG